LTVSTPTETAADRSFRLVGQAIEDPRPFLRADGGDCELVGIEDDIVRVKMSGASVGCQFASITLGLPLRVVPVPSFR
jgi:NifU-like protein